jgi:hypothetical protein
VDKSVSRPKIKVTLEIDVDNMGSYQVIDSISELDKYFERNLSLTWRTDTWYSSEIEKYNKYKDILDSGKLIYIFRTSNEGSYNSVDYLMYEHIDKLKDIVSGDLEIISVGYED